MNNYGVPQSELLSRPHGDAALLHLRERIPPERIGGEKTIVAGMPP
jgi:hypothetical protein